jgi:hypothetical protein
MPGDLGRQASTCRWSGFTFQKTARKTAHIRSQLTPHPFADQEHKVNIMLKHGSTVISGPDSSLSA